MLPLVNDGVPVLKLGYCGGTNDTSMIAPARESTRPFFIPRNAPILPLPMLAVFPPLTIFIPGTYDGMDNEDDEDVDDDNDNDGSLVVDIGFGDTSRGRPLRLLGNNNDEVRLLPLLVLAGNGRLIEFDDDAGVIETAPTVNGVLSPLGDVVVPIVKNDETSTSSSVRSNASPVVVIISPVPVPVVARDEVNKLT
jgi:hypothetical protein